MDTISCFWMGKPPGLLELTCLRSWIRFHPVKLYSYEQIDLPADLSGVQQLYAGNILHPAYQFEFTGRGESYNFLPFADLFRFKMLDTTGGIWLDLDITLQKPIPPDILIKPYAFSSERTIQKGAYKNKFKEIPDIGFLSIREPGSPLTQFILNKMSNKKLNSPFDYMICYRKGLKELQLNQYVLPAEAFLPLNWWDIKDAVLTNKQEYQSKYGVPGFKTSDPDSPDSYGIHWFRAILRKKSINLEDAKEQSLWNKTLLSITS